MKNILQLVFTTIFVTVLFNTVYAQTGPGGVGGHENSVSAGSPVNALWLKASDLNLNDGDFVTSWTDASGYNHLAVPGLAGKQGIFFNTNQINGLPWVTFHGINYLKVPNHDVLDGGEGYGLFVVAKRNPIVVEKYEPGYNTLVAKRAHWNAWFHVTSIPMTAEGLQHAYELRWDRFRNALDKDSMNVTAYMNGNLPDGSGADVFAPIWNTDDIDATYMISHLYSNHNDSYGSKLRINGIQENRPGRGEGNPNPLRVGPVVKSPKDLWIGGAQYDPPGSSGGENDACPTCTETGLLEGSIAEVILYKGTLWHSHIFIIENYLALKYGLPLVDTVQYYTDDVFVHDLVGIGNEFGDDKKHSGSTSHALTIEELNESLNAPKEYIFTAHDGGAYEWVKTDLPPTAQDRWARTWKLEKTGDIDARLSFNFITAELNLVNSQAPRFRVAYRENPDDQFTILGDIEPTRSLKTLQFIVPNESLKSGYYTIVFGYDPDATNVLVQDNFSKSLRVYPSPAQSDINVSFANYSQGQVNIRILDIAGREVMTVTDVKTEDNFQRNISINHLNNGVYFLEVAVDGNRGVRRIVKQ